MPAKQATGSIAPHIPQALGYEPSERGFEANMSIC